MNYTLVFAYARLSCFCESISQKTTIRTSFQLTRLLSCSLKKKKKNKNPGAGFILIPPYVWTVFEGTFNFYRLYFCVWSPSDPNLQQRLTLKILTSFLFLDTSLLNWQLLLLVKPVEPNSIEVRPQILWAALWWRRIHLSFRRFLSLTYKKLRPRIRNRQQHPVWTARMIHGW